MSADWTDARFALLKQLWEEGWRRQIIAQKLGGGVTPNAVSGMVFRKKYERLMSAEQRDAIEMTKAEPDELWLFDRRDRSALKDRVPARPAKPRVVADNPAPPEPVVEPEIVPEPQPAPEPAPQPEITPPTPQPEIAPEPVPEIVPPQQPEIVPPTSPDIMPEIVPDPQPEPFMEPVVDIVPDLEPEPEPESVQAVVRQREEPVDENETHVRITKSPFAGVPDVRSPHARLWFKRELKQCAYPVGPEPDRPNNQECCCNKTIAGKPYCIGHFNIMFPEKRRRV